MSRDREYLLDILQAARLAMGYVADKTKSEFLGDPLCQDAVIRRLEIIGEAARRTSKATRSSLPELPWEAMVAMRNIMIHKYDDVDLRIVWDTVRKDLPPLASELENVVPPDEPAG